MSVEQSLSKPNFWGLVEQKGPWKQTRNDVARSRRAGFQHPGHGDWKVLINPYQQDATKPSPTLSTVLQRKVTSAPLRFAAPPQRTRIFGGVDRRKVPLTDPIGGPAPENEEGNLATNDQQIYERIAQAELRKRTIGTFMPAASFSHVGHISLDNSAKEQVNNVDRVATASEPPRKLHDDTYLAQLNPDQLQEIHQAIGHLGNLNHEQVQTISTNILNSNAKTQNMVAQLLKSQDGEKIYEVVNELLHRSYVPSQVVNMIDQSHHLVNVDQSQLQVNQAYATDASVNTYLSTNQQNFQQNFQQNNQQNNHQNNQLIVGESHRQIVGPESNSLIVHGHADSGFKCIGGRVGGNGQLQIGAGDSRMQIEDKPRLDVAIRGDRSVTKRKAESHESSTALVSRKKRKSPVTKKPLQILPKEPITAVA